MSNNAPKLPTVKVKQMRSPNSNNYVANQFIIYTDDGTYFQSYNSIIAFCDKQGQTWLDKYYWDYSRTTSRYRNEFLGETTKETRAKIKSGEYKLANLN